MRKHPVAVIGCGNIAQSAHIPSYIKTGRADIRYLVDILPDKARVLQEKFDLKDAKVVTDYRELLADPELEAVSVCLPNYLHEPVSVDFLRSGKHVLCEKPIALNSEQALRMQAVAKENGKILNIGVVNRFSTAVNRIRDIIRSGELGEVYHIYCSFRDCRCIPGMGGWFTTKAQSGGGVLIDWGVHFIDLILYCLDNPRPLTVTGKTFCQLGKDMENYTYLGMWAGPPDYSGTYDVDDYVTALVRTEGPTISLNGAWAQNVNETAMYVEFLGSKGGIKLHYGKDFEELLDRNGALQNIHPAFQMADMFADEVANFLDCIETPRVTRAHIDNVLITQKVLDMIYLSSQEGREIQL